MRSTCQSRLGRLSCHTTMIIAEQDNGSWNAWLEGVPCVSFAGDSAAVAVSRLCESENIDTAQLVCLYSKSTKDHLEFATGDRPDCGGTGKYVGLVSVENCGTCGGSGKCGQFKVDPIVVARLAAELLAEAAQEN